jgi:sugar phosphate isomerase/epimerase
LNVAADGSATAVRELLVDLDIRPGWFALTPRNFSGDEADWERDLEGLPELCASMSEIGFRRALIVVLPFAESLDFETNFERHVNRIRHVAGILLPYDILLGLEYIGPVTRRCGYPHLFVHDMKGALELRAAVDRRNVGIFLDCFHWYCARERPADIEALDPSWIAGAHINDAFAGRTIDEQIAFERQLPGTSGLIDLVGFLRALQTIGYDGPVTCEPMSGNLAQLTLPEAVRKTAEAIEVATDGLV